MISITLCHLKRLQVILELIHQVSERVSEAVVNHLLDHPSMGPKLRRKELKAWLAVDHLRATGPAAESLITKAQLALEGQLAEPWLIVHVWILFWAAPCAFLAASWHRPCSSSRASLRRNSTCRWTRLAAQDGMRDLLNFAAMHNIEGQAQWLQR